ncbi:MAG: hypothetical protein DHS80DRAFT_33685 [Piptocephalis tieghemiana]|nr:MAG: hypothetical protein DHS80DRAFT_33685 [Piptocephalis tieghemiana]
MSNLRQNASQYGRRTWDTSEYADKERRLKLHDARKEEEEALRRQGIKLPKRRYRDAPDATPLEARKEASSKALEATVGKRSAVGASGRAGFHCEACQRTYQDSLTWLDHLNTNRHLRLTGHGTQVKRATLEDVRAKLDEMTERLGKPREEYNLQDRLAQLGRERKNRVEKRKEARRKRRMKKQKGAQEGETGAGMMDPDMAVMMGFSGFGTTKH